jgi:hypothetical protein
VNKLGCNLLNIGLVVFLERLQRSFQRNVVERFPRSVELSRFGVSVLVNSEYVKPKMATVIRQSKSKAWERMSKGYGLNSVMLVTCAS